MEQRQRVLLLLPLPLRPTDRLLFPRKERSFYTTALVSVSRFSATTIYRVGKVSSDADVVCLNDSAVFRFQTRWSSGSHCCRTVTVIRSPCSLRGSSHNGPELNLQLHH
ncbi:hypothetical protein JOB18_002528 [Solea senegalensis]|uniref:Secreted protein n=1 Tax=Solea senegalensis TaxID=28829 RepID=A0AAV6QRA5_SOLSE|nr:hypothetical protein JOB18_002528 [Solea senegalensis]